MRLLSRGDVVLKTPSDFLGDAVGMSEKQMQKILDATVGKVLVIDEAYMLDPGDSGKEQDKSKSGIIGTIVANVHGAPGEDHCIIMLGYEDRIIDTFHNANPGLTRRFNMKRMFKFENYNLSELDQIMTLKMSQQNLTCTPDGRKVAHDIFKRALQRPNFENASEVESCLADAKLNFENRQLTQTSKTDVRDEKLEANDFDKDLQRSQVNCRELLTGKVSRSIIDKFASYQTRCHAAKQCGYNPRDFVPTRYIFKGFPGTGKMITAKHMGQSFYNMGFLATSDVVQYSTTDLIGEYVGHTSPKTKKVLHRALGKVLFLSGVSRLNKEGTFAAEAINELFYFLSQPGKGEKFVVILAGDVTGIDTLMSKRADLSGLFRDEVLFNHLSPDECISLLIRRLEEKDMHTNSDPLHNIDIKTLFQKMKQLADWRNAHDVEYLTKEIFGRCLNNIDLASAEQQPLEVTASLVTSCMRDTFEHRSRRSNNNNTTTTNKNNKSPSTDPMFEDLFSHLYSLNPATRTTPPTSPSTPNPAEEQEQEQKQEQTLHSHSYNTATAYKEKQQNDSSDDDSSDDDSDTDSEDTPPRPQHPKLNLDLPASLQSRRKTTSSPPRRPAHRHKLQTLSRGK